MASIKKQTGETIVYGYSVYLNRLRPRKKRALLSYLTSPVVDSLEKKRIIRFSNNGIVLSWVRVLNELGYKVDVIDWGNKTAIPKESYDLVVFHGGKNFEEIRSNLGGNPKMIHFLTGSYWLFNNQAEDERIKIFTKRHGVKPARDRYIFDSEDEVNEACDGIIVLGDPSMKDTYPKHYKKVLTINNASYPDTHFKSSLKDYESVRQNFLFFAGSGNIHKGLDLLIDSFKDLKEHLYIVTVPDKEVLDVYKKELKLPNIHLVGEVNMRDPAFYEVMDKCAYVILPSCSEGQAGSVVEAMNQGLIPIVSKETRLDASSYGVVLPDNTIGTIKKTVRKMASLKAGEVERLSHLTFAKVQEEHTPEFFRHSLKRAIKDVLSSQK